MEFRSTWSPASLAVALLSTAFVALGQQPAPERYPDVPFVPTPQPIIDQMLSLAGVHPGDRLVDLGSGDGRIVITAAKRYGIDAVGVEINPALVRQARENAAAAGVTAKTTFVEGDLFDYDLRKATVVTIFLLPGINMRLKPKLLKELQPGARVVSHRFDMGLNWPPEKTEVILGEPIYLWTIPKRP